MAMMRPRLEIMSTVVCVMRRSVLTLSVSAMRVLMTSPTVVVLVMSRVMLVEVMLPVHIRPPAAGFTTMMASSIVCGKVVLSTGLVTAALVFLPGACILHLAFSSATERRVEEKPPSYLVGPSVELCRWAWMSLGKRMRLAGSVE